MYKINKATKEELYKDIFSELFKHQDLEYLIHGIHLNACISIVEDTEAAVLVIEAIGVEGLVVWSSTVEAKNKKPITIGMLKAFTKLLPDFEERLEKELQREWNELK